MYCYLVFNLLLIQWSALNSYCEHCVATTGGLVHSCGTRAAVLGALSQQDKITINKATKNDNIEHYKLPTCVRHLMVCAADVTST